MNTRRIVIILIIAVNLSWSAIASAHRYFPEAPTPIVVEGIEYSAPQDIAHIGYVQAFEHASGRKLWESKVYSVWIDPLVEADVQWIFITNIQFIAGKLVVTNELGNSFSLDPATGKVESGIRNHLAPIVFVSVPIVFLISIIFAIILVRKLLLARAIKHYSSSQDENNIYIYFGTTGGILAGLLALFLCFTALGGLLQSVIEVGVGETYFSDNIIIPDMNLYLEHYLVLTLLILLMFSGGVYLSSLLGELIILIKRKTKNI